MSEVYPEDPSGFPLVETAPCHPEPEAFASIHMEIVGAGATGCQALFSEKDAPPPTVAVIELNPLKMKAQYVLRENIKALLRARKEDASTLAGSLNRDKSWINKILNGHRNMQVEDFDLVADFFGIATYQLFQPGISALTERRVQTLDRRTGRDRRIGHAHRVMMGVATELERASTKGRHNEDTGISAEQVRTLVDTFEKQVQALLSHSDARRRTALAGSAQPRSLSRRRNAGPVHDPKDSADDTAP